MSKQRPLPPEQRPVSIAPAYTVDAAGNVYSKRLGTPLEVRENRGYRRVRLCVQGRQTLQYVAVLVLTAFLGERPAGYVVGYKDGDKGNCALDNLEWREPAVVNAAVLPRDFVRIWQAAATTMEVAERTGMTLHAVYARVKAMRAKGVPLKTLQRPRLEDADYEGLADLARQLSEEA